MHAFQGNLLIGGMRLSHVQGEIETEVHDDGSHDWILSGRIVLSPQEGAYLELWRQYRLELDDGRASQVMLSRLEASDDQHIVAEFVPQNLQSSTP